MGLGVQSLDLRGFGVWRGWGVSNISMYYIINLVWRRRLQNTARIFVFLTNIGFSIKTLLQFTHHFAFFFRKYPYLKTTQLSSICGCLFYICLVEKNQYNYIYSYKGICFIITIINMLIVREISFSSRYEGGGGFYGHSGRMITWIYLLGERFGTE